MNLFPVIFTFDKSVGGTNDRVEISVSSDQTVFQVLNEVCNKNGILYNEHFQVFNHKGRNVEIGKSIGYNKISEGSELIINEDGMKKLLDRHYYGHIATTSRLWTPLAIVALVISIVGLIVLIVIFGINRMTLYSYSVVIDAGSTSSKIYLYSWPGNNFIFNADVSQIADCKAEPGISSYEDNPSLAFGGIKDCLDRDIMPKIPTDQKSSSYIFLGATAGMRMLSYKNPNATNRIMNLLRNSLSAYALKITNTMTDISIIPGFVEGLTGWITVNYLLDSFPKTGGDATSIIGAMDMGGASTQVTFLNSHLSNSTDTSNLNLYGKSYRVYSHSYLCYGKSQAELRLLAMILHQNNFTTTAKNPCMFLGEVAMFPAEEIFFKPCIFGKFAIDHYGYEIIPPQDFYAKNVTFYGTSNYTQCFLLVTSLFNASKCGDDSSCTFNGVYQPKLTGRFGAFSAYPMLKEHLNPKNENLNLNEYKMRLEITCDNASKTHNPNADVYAKWLCFDLTFLIEMLVKLGFTNDNWKNVEFFNTIRNYNIGWSLGYMINKTAIIPKQTHFLPIRNDLFGILVAVLLLILLFAVVFIIMMLKVRKSRTNCTDVNCETIEEQNLLSTTSRD